jgi:hypothetical protein
MKGFLEEIGFTVEMSVDDEIDDIESKYEIL